MIEIREAGTEDVLTLLEIERECFSVPWSETGIRFSVESDDTYVPVAVDRGRIVGFAILHRSFEDGELFNIAVRGGERGKNIGSLLMASVLKNCRENGVRKLYLEVRVSNHPAKALYDKFEFESLGVRKNYYDHPKEDAEIMIRETERGPDYDNNGR